MKRVATIQTDLFPVAQADLCPSSAPASPPSPLDAVGELSSLLERLRRSSALPWVDAAAAMAEEHRALWLARQAGDEGAELAAAIFVETERLFASAEQSALR